MIAKMGPGRLTADANNQQRDYYDLVAKRGGYGEASTGAATRLWSHTRDRLWQFRSDAGLDNIVSERQKDWLNDVSSMSILEVGAGTGSLLTGWLVENAKSYTAIDLSPKSIELIERQYSSPDKARKFVVGDILHNEFSDSSFDAIYACSVVHHFQDLSSLLNEFRRLLTIDGMVITFDPLQTEPLNRIARKAYRPFQADRDWEFPLSKQSIESIQLSFDIADVQGLLGRSKIGIPLYFLPGMSTLAARWSQRLSESDKVRYRSLNADLLNCWQVSFLLKMRH